MPWTKKYDVAALLAFTPTAASAEIVDKVPSITEVGIPALIAGLACLLLPGAVRWLVALPTIGVNALYLVAFLSDYFKPYMRDAYNTEMGSVYVAAMIGIPVIVAVLCSGLLITDFRRWRRRRQEPSQ